MECGIIKLFLQIVLCLLLARSVEPVTGPRHGKMVVCYVSSWSIYEKDGLKYQIEHLDPNLCTHIVYVFAILDEENNSIKSADRSADVDLGGYMRWTDLKQNYTHLKVSLGVGGWNDGYEKWMTLAANRDRRRKFAKNVLAYLRRYNFDGVDFHLRTPELPFQLAEFKTNYVSLIRDLYEKFRGTNLMIMTIVNPLPETIDSAYDIQGLAQYIDYFHIKTFDYGGPWLGRVSPTAPLRSTTGLSVENTIEKLLSEGMNPSKMIMAVPFLGQYYRTDFAGNFGDPSDPATDESSYFFSRICRQITQRDPVIRVTWDDTIAQYRATYSEGNKTVVVVYDGGRSVVRKTRFAIKTGLAGIMVYFINNDDFMGVCQAERDAFDDYSDTSLAKLRIPSVTSGKHQLLRILNQAIELTLDEIDRSEYFLSLLKIHMEIDGIDTKDTNLCYKTANVYLRMLQTLLDLHSSNVKLDSRSEL